MPCSNLCCPPHIAKVCRKTKGKLAGCIVVPGLELESEQCLHGFQVYQLWFAEQIRSTLLGVANTIVSKPSIELGTKVACYLQINTLRILDVTSERRLFNSSLISLQWCVHHCRRNSFLTPSSLQILWQRLFLSTEYCISVGLQNIFNRGKSFSREYCLTWRFLWTSISRFVMHVDQTSVGDLSVTLIKVWSVLSLLGVAKSRTWPAELNVQDNVLPPLLLFSLLLSSDCRRPLLTCFLAFPCLRSIELDALERDRLGFPPTIVAV